MLLFQIGGLSVGVAGALEYLCRQTMHTELGTMLRFLAILAVVATAWPGAAKASDKFPLELNRVEQVGGACSVYLRFKNPDDRRIEAFKLDLVFFDKQEIIRDRLYVELGPAPPTKTAVRLFDIPDFECAELGSILVNDVVECKDNSGADMSCLSRLELSSRSDVSLFY